MRANITFVALASILMFAPAMASAQASASCLPGLPVSLSVTSELAATVPSASIGFHAIMQNQSTSLIHDATLAVDVIQKNTGAVVDRFFVTQPIALLSQSAGKIDFIWKVPSALPSGTYTVAVTLVPSGETLAEIFSGALQPTASRDIVVQDGAAPDASVVALTVNGNPYTLHTAARVSAGNSQIVAATVNTTQVPYIGTLTWRLYAADATSTGKALDTQTQAVDLHPGTSSDVRYLLTDASRDGYFLEGQLSDGHTTHYIDVWLERTNSTFPFLGCANAGSPLSGAGDTRVIAGTILALLLLALAWRYLERRRSA